MTLIIDLPPDRESALRAAADIRGMSPEAYALWLVDHGLPLSQQDLPISLDEAESLLDGLASATPETPVLPEEAHSRTNYYQDHD